MKTTEALSGITEQIKSDLGGDLTLRRQLHGGVSGSKVILAELDHRGNVSPVVLKFDTGRGQVEAAGIKTLRPHLSTPDILHDGPDHVLTPYYDRPSLNEVIKEGTSLERRAAVVHFVGSHKKMWEETTAAEAPLDGYPKKVNETKESIYRMQISDVTLGEHSSSEFVINGRSIGTLEAAMDTMSQIIAAQKRGVLTHGDEGFGNCLVQTDENQIMVDCGTFGIRSPFESIAKMLLWLQATRSRPEGYELATEKGRVILNTRESLDPGLRQATDVARQSLDSFFDTPEDHQGAAAFMMMYNLREIQWLKARNREQMAPHLLAAGLLYAEGMYNRQFPFPLVTGEHKK